MCYTKKYVILGTRKCLSMHTCTRQVYSDLCDYSHLENLIGMTTGQVQSLFIKCHPEYSIHCTRAGSKMNTQARMEYMHLTIVCSNYVHRYMFTNCT